MDCGPEPYVGRLPVYQDSASLLDTLLAKALAHDLDSDKGYRGRVLLPGARFAIAGAPSPTSGDCLDNSDASDFAAARGSIHHHHGQLPDLRQHRGSG